MSYYGDNDIDPDIIEIENDSEDDGPSTRRAMLEPIINRVVNALGGLENGVYRFGHESYNCLKDLKKLWRKDDTDDERTVARIFWETKLLPNDLVHVLLATAGKGMVEDKRAIVCADLITAMTWPIDIAEELKELDEDQDQGTDYTKLVQSHIHYKASLLQNPSIFQALLGIALPPLTRNKKERTQRDGQIINIILHLIRNLAFIQDLVPNIHLSDEHIELTTLQSKLITSLVQSQLMELLLTIATNSENDPLLKSWNTIVLEIFYLLFRDVKPETLVRAKTEQEKSNMLQELLAKETSIRREYNKIKPTRHSRFGTTVALSLRSAKTGDQTGDGNSSQNLQQFVLSRQQAIRGETNALMDSMKKRTAKPMKKLDEISRPGSLSHEAQRALKRTAHEFVRSAFNPFLASVLKDIKSERPNVTQKDNLRLLFVTRWFLEFFLLHRKAQLEAKAEKPPSFGAISVVTEGGWMTWVLRRMREAVDEKPTLWVELQAGVECLTQILLLTDAMSATDIIDPALSEAAETLQHQIIYNGEVLDLAFLCLKSYKDRTQSLAYLDASVHLAYALMRMLERLGKGNGEVYVRQKVKKRKKKKGAEEDEEERLEQEDESYIDEIMFTFEAFEMRFAQSEVTEALLHYLMRYRQFSGSDKLKRVVGLMHRQAVKAKAEGLFFQVSTLDLFNTLLGEKSSFPKEQPYKDLLSLIRYILRQFFKRLEEDSFLATEALFPKNRSTWKQFSSWEAPEKPARISRAQADKAAKGIKPGQDVHLQEGIPWSDQIGVAVGALLHDNQKELVDWVQEILSLVIVQKRKVVEKVDGEDVEVPSPAAIQEFELYSIPYTSNDQAEAASSNVWLRLLFRLAKFRLMENDEEEPEWYVPAALLPAELEKVRRAILGYLDVPYDLEGRNVWDLVEKKRKRVTRRRRRKAESGSEGEEEEDEEAAERKKKKKERKKQEKQQYKSARFIEDSDEEMEGLEEFLKQEAARRARTARKAGQDPSEPVNDDKQRSAETMRAGTETEVRDELGGAGTTEIKKRGRSMKDGEEGGRQKRSRMEEMSSDSE